MYFLNIFTRRSFWVEFFIGILFGLVILLLWWGLAPWKVSIPFDFLIHYQASQRFLMGKSPYVDWNLPTPYNYPPTIFPFVFWLAFFKLRMAFIIWQGFSILSLLVSVFLITKIVRDRETSVSSWPDPDMHQGLAMQIKTFLLFLVFLRFFPTRFGLFMGQINNFILLALVLFFYNLLKAFFSVKINSNNKRDLKVVFKDSEFWVGWWLAIASFLKLTPMIFVPYLLLRGCKKALVSFFSVVIVVFLASGMAFGFHHYILWWERMRPPLFSMAGKGAYYNQALSGFVARAVGEEALGLKLTMALETLALVATFSLVQVINFKNQMGGWRIARRIIKEKELLELSLFLVTMLLVNRLTWQHHLVWVLPAFIFSAYCFIKEKQWSSLLSLGLCFILLNHNFPRFENLRNNNLSFLYLSHGTWGLLILWGVIILNLLLAFKVEAGISKLNIATRKNSSNNTKDYSAG